MLCRQIVSTNYHQVSQLSEEGPSADSQCLAKHSRLNSHCVVLYIGLKPQTERVRKCHSCCPLRLFIKGYAMVCFPLGQMFHTDFEHLGDVDRGVYQKGSSRLICIWEWRLLLCLWEYPRCIFGIPFHKRENDLMLQVAAWTGPRCDFFISSLDPNSKADFYKA